MNHKVKTFVETQISNLKKSLIFKNADGSYNLFEKFTIVPQNKHFVVYVLDYMNIEKIVFSSLKNAVTWCILKNKNKIKEYTSLKELDFCIDSLNFSIKLHQKLLNSASTTQDQIIYAMKLEEDKRNKEIVLEKINQHIWFSKNLENNKLLTKI